MNGLQPMVKVIATDSRTQMLPRVISMILRVLVTSLPFFALVDLYCTQRDYAGSKKIALSYESVSLPRDGYLLDSPSPYRLWFRFDLPSGVKDSIQGNGLDCQGLLHEAKEELAAAF